MSCTPFCLYMHVYYIICTLIYTIINVYCVLTVFCSRMISIIYVPFMLHVPTKLHIKNEQCILSTCMQAAN